MCELEFMKVHSLGRHVGRIGSTLVDPRDKAAAAADDDGSHHDVEEGGVPEGEQGQRLLAVQIRGGRALVVVGRVNVVDPHVIWSGVELTQQTMKTLARVFQVMQNSVGFWAPPPSGRCTGGRRAAPWPG